MASLVAYFSKVTSVTLARVGFASCWCSFGGWFRVVVVGWEELPVFFLAKKPGTDTTFFLQAMNRGALSQAPNCWSIGLRLPSLSI